MTTDINSKKSYSPSNKYCFTSCKETTPLIKKLIAVHNYLFNVVCYVNRMILKTYYKGPNLKKNRGIPNGGRYEGSYCPPRAFGDSPLLSQ